MADAGLASGRMNSRFRETIKEFINSLTAVHEKPRDDHSEHGQWVRLPGARNFESQIRFQIWDACPPLDSPFNGARSKRRRIIRFKSFKTYDGGKEECLYFSVAMN